jgi:autotransporter-associated beta strand protein
LGSQTLTVIATDTQSLAASSNLVISVVAENEVWNGGAGDNKWTSGANWVTGAQPLTNDYVTFAGTTQLTANMDASFTISSLTFSNDAGSFAITNANSTLTLAGGLTNNSTSVQTVDVPVALSGSQTINAASGNVTISRVVSGSGVGLTKLGSSMLTLSGANTYSGATTISSGSLTVSGSGSLGGGSYSASVVDNGTLNYNSSAAQTLSGVVSGTGTLAISSGTVTLSGANTFSGGTTISSGTVTAGNNATFGVGSVTLSGGTLNNNGAYTLTNNFVISGSGSAIQLGSANNLTFSGGISGSGSLTLGNNANNSTVGLNNVNTMTGGTITIANSGNAIRFQSASAGSTNVDWVFNNTTANKETIDFASGTISFGSISGAGRIQGNNAGVMSAVLSVGGNNNSTIFTGTIFNNQFGTGTIGLTKVGSGSLTLSGANAYSGQTIVSNGTLNVSSVQTGAGAFTVADSATLGVNLAAAGATLNVSSLTLGNSTNSFTGISSTTAAAVTNVGVLTLNGTVTVNAQGATITVGQYPLIASAGGITGTGGFVVGTLPLGAVATIITNGNTIVLDVTTAPSPLVWAGTVNNNWDTATTNWSFGASPSLYVDSVETLFNDTSSQTNVNVAAVVAPTTITVANNTLDYTFTNSTSAKITGSTGINKSGSGRLTLAGTSNDFTGVVQIDGGTVVVSGNANLGSAAGTVGLNGTLSATQGFTLSRTISVGPGTGTGNGVLDVAAGQVLTNNNSMGNNSSGTGTLVKTGSGTLQLGAISTYTGGTVVSNGTLVLATGGGAGAVRGTLTINSGAAGSLATLDALGYNNDATRVATVNLVGGTLDNAVNVNQGYRTLFNLTGGTMSSTGGGAFNFTTGQTISSLASSTMSSITAPIQLRDTATLTFDVATGTVPSGIDLNVSGSINQQNAGSGITKRGAGTLVLSGVNAYTGTTTVSNGTLQVNGSLASGATVTTTNATLGGTGTVNGAVTVNVGGTLNPGVSNIGTLTIGNNLTLSATSTNSFAVTANGASNSVVLTGTLTPNGSLVKITAGAALSMSTNTLFTYGTLSGSFNATPVIDVAPVHTPTIVDDGAGHINLVVANHAPVASDISMGATSGEAASIKILGGKHTPTDADGDTLILTIASQPTNGTAITDGTNVTYTSTNSFTGSDSFTYTVSDAYGGTATATVTVTVVANGEGFNTLASPVVLGGGDFRLSYLGVPGYAYALDWTSNLMSPVTWTPQMTNTAPTSGILTYTNNQLGSPNFWRTRYVP